MSNKEKIQKTKIEIDKIKNLLSDKEGVSRLPDKGERLVKKLQILETELKFLETGKEEVKEIAMKEVDIKKKESNFGKKVQFETKEIEMSEKVEKITKQLEETKIEEKEVEMTEKQAPKGPPKPPPPGFAKKSWSPLSGPLGPTPPLALTDITSNPNKVTLEMVDKFMIESKKLKTGERPRKNQSMRFMRKLEGLPKNLQDRVNIIGDKLKAQREEEKSSSKYKGIIALSEEESKKAFEKNEKMWEKSGTSSFQELKDEVLVEETMEEE